MTDTTLAGCVTLPVVPAMPEDALSNPTGTALLRPMLATLPRGSVWRTDYVADAEDPAAPVSFLHRFWRAVAEPMADLYAKSWELVLQSTACTVTTALADWEAEFGLPDPCVAASADFTDRLAALREKVAGEGGGSIPYFICVAARLGYRIDITEPHWFECGVSSFEAGGLQPTYFECGVSRFGNDRFSDFTGSPADLTDAFAPGLTPASIVPSYFECGDSSFGNDRFSDFTATDPFYGVAWARSYWIVHVYDTDARYFEFGASSFGTDCFSDFNSALDLECLFAARRPAHTTLIFDYSGLALSGAAALPANIATAFGI